MKPSVGVCVFYKILKHIIQFIIIYIVVVRNKTKWRLNSIFRAKTSYISKWPPRLQMYLCIQPQVPEEITRWAGTAKRT